MADAFYDDQDQGDQRDKEQALREAGLVHAMTLTDGWKILERDLLKTREAQERTLLDVPMTPENIPQLAVAQAQAKACNLPLDIVKAYADTRNALLEESSLMPD